MARTELLTIPRRFYDDHAERALDTPDAVRETKRTVTIRRDDPALASLRSDAEFYADTWGPDAAPRGVTLGAKALLRALRDR